MTDSYWIKLYTEFVTDPKMRRLTMAQRGLWASLLCIAAQSPRFGKLYISENIQADENDLMGTLGLTKEDHKFLKDSLQLFEKLEMLIKDENGAWDIKNFEKRQGSTHPGMIKERVKRHRETKGLFDSNEDETDVKQDSNDPVTKSVLSSLILSSSYLSNIPTEDLKEFTSRFTATERQIKSKGEDLKLYCQRKGRQYKNYKAFLLNALKRDFSEKDAPKEGKYASIS